MFGTLAATLGCVGIFTPGIPATPLFLLSAYLYSKSSPRLHHLLVNNKVIGKYISSYVKKGGMSIKSKVIANVFMLGMVTISTLFFIEVVAMKIVAISLGFIGSMVVIFYVKTVED